jgi:hypothetical protein
MRRATYREAMFIGRRAIGVSFAVLFAVACAGQDDGDDEAAGSSESTTAPADDDGASLTAADDAPAESSGGPGPGDDSSGDDPTVTITDGSTDAGGDSTSDGGGSDDESGSSSGGGVVYDEDFMWVADFLRANCVVCHATNANGNLVLGMGDITNDEVIVALDGVVATTGLLLVQPGDREMSQTWLQITNEFGAQFPVEDTDRFGDWIDAGANYYAQ